MWQLFEVLPWQISKVKKTASKLDRQLRPKEDTRITHGRLLALWESTPLRNCGGVVVKGDDAVIWSHICKRWIAACDAGLQYVMFDSQFARITFQCPTFSFSNTFGWGLEFWIRQLISRNESFKIFAKKKRWRCLLCWLALVTNVILTDGRTESWISSRHYRGH